jgi:parallel beta-helix repeat protein
MVEYRMSVKAELVLLYVDDDNTGGPWDGASEHPYENITSALEHAIDGDTILVRSGTYYENVVVNKSVSLIGEDRNSTIVDGGENGSVVSITIDNVSIEGFTIMRSGMGLYDSGIFVEHSSGNDISNNIMINNYNGISFYSSSGNAVSGNTIRNNYNGISFYSSSGNAVSGNTITSNNEGIRLYYSSNGNVVSGNTIRNNYNGISFYFSSGNAVSGNTIRNNYNGISFYSSSGNAVSGNTITSNNEGIYLAFHSASNIIYCNNFNNTHQVWSDSTNIWNDGSKGNYWSDYNGTDDDQDGIGETPYIINENNKDKYPLMGMFSDFRFIFNEETHHVNVISNSTIADFRFEIGQETGNKMISFNATGEGGSVGFCRVMIPIELMNYSYIVLVGMEKIFPTRLNGTSETYDYLYFTYIQNNHTITIISSETLYLYYELLDKYIRLETDLYDLNATYRELLNNYTDFLTNYSDSLINCSELQKSHQQLNNSYQEFLLDYSKKVNNIQNLMYILAATTAIFIITTIYLSRSAHAGKSKVFQEGRKKRTP